MPTATSSQSDTKHTEQQILNRAFDPDFQALVVESIVSDPAGSTSYRKVTGDLATRIVISGTDIYIGKATPGSATSSAVWQVKKIDTASDIIITWADSNANFDNLFSNPSSLTYG